MACSAVFSQNPDSTALYYTRVNYPTEASHLPSGYFYYLKQKENYLNNGDTLKAIDAQRMAAIASFKLGNFNESEQLTVEALGWLQAGTFPKEYQQPRMLGLYNQLGKIYRNKAHFSKALEYYNLALTHVETVSDSITVYNNRANIYMDLGEYPPAERDLQRAIAMSRRSNDTLLWARALNNFGVLKLKYKDTGGAEDIQKALTLRKVMGNKEGMYSSYRHLALFALSEKDTVAAYTFATSSLIIAKELNSASYLLESLSILMDLKNDTLVSQYKTLTDSLNLVKQEEQNLYAAMRFDVEKEMLNTRQALLDVEKERNQKILILIISVLLLGVFVLIITLILSRIKRIKQAEVLKTEIRFSKKVHDEVANDVYQVMTKVQFENESHTELLDDLEAIYNKTRDISKESGFLDVTNNFDRVLQDLLWSYKNKNVTVITRNIKKITWNSFSENKKITIYRVLQELMTNMKKHSNASIVVVSFHQTGRNLEIIYKDNGQGCALSKHTGLHNAESRMHAMKGSITFVSKKEKGFQATLKI